MNAATPVIVDLDWARLLYQTKIEDIREAKKRQWSITNYVLLSYAAIIGFCNNFVSVHKNFCVLEQGFLTCTAVLVCLAGIYLLMDCQKSMMEYRSDIERIQRIVFTSLQIFFTSEELHDENLL